MHAAPHKFVVMLKTYRDDALYVRRLIDSMARYNVDNVPLYVVCPDEDINIFKEICSRVTATILPESLFQSHLTSEFVQLEHEDFTIRPGYINQEIVKIAFWEIGVADNYLCIDSDAEFIRPFYASDFIAPDSFPYTTLTEDFSLIVDSYYYHMCGWEGRKKRIQRINEAIDFPQTNFETSHGCVVFNSRVLKDFYENFMLKNGFSYIGILKICPYEFSWYNMWLQKTKVIPIHKREPIILCFHHEQQLKQYKSAGIALADLARAYVAIVVNSNFQPDRGGRKPISYETYIDFVPQRGKMRILIYLLRQCLRDAYSATKLHIPTPIRKLLGKVKRVILH